MVSYNLQNSLIDLIHKGEINIKSNPNSGLDTFERNLQLIIDVCNAKKIKLILSSYCNILHEEVKNSSLHIKYAEIMEKENKIVKKVSG